MHTRSQKAERTSWQRDSRLKAYAGFFEAFHEYTHRILEAADAIPCSKDSMDAKINEVRVARRIALSQMGVVNLLASDELASATVKLMVRAQELTEAISPTVRPPQEETMLLGRASASWAAAAKRDLYGEEIGQVPVAAADEFQD